MSNKQTLVFFMSMSIILSLLILKFQKIKIFYSHPKPKLDSLDKPANKTKVRNVFISKASSRFKLMVGRNVLIEANRTDARKHILFC